MPIDADQVWAMLVRSARDGHDAWRRAVVERTGLPFSRIRVLKRLEPGPISLTNLAHAAAIDRPAATVAVNELEQLNLAAREVDPHNRRCKLVSITAAGRGVLELVRATSDPAPAALLEFTADELTILARMLARLDR